MVLVAQICQASMILLDADKGTPAGPRGIKVSHTTNDNVRCTKIVFLSVRTCLVASKGHGWKATPMAPRGM